MRMITCSFAAIALLAGCAAPNTPEAEHSAAEAPVQAQVQAVPVSDMPPFRPTGVDTYNAEKLAKNRACAAQPLGCQGPRLHFSVGPLALRLANGWAAQARFLASFSAL